MKKEEKLDKICEEISICPDCEIRDTLNCDFNICEKHEKAMVKVQLTPLNNN